MRFKWEKSQILRITELEEGPKSHPPPSQIPPRMIATQKLPKQETNPATGANAHVSHFCAAG